MEETKESTINTILARGVEQVIVEDDLKQKLLSGKKIRLYFGIDPTGAKLHLGHAVVLRKLREFADLEHEVILLIGDFTAKIGDPSGKDVMRVPLSDKQIKDNMQDYKKQASKILDFKKVKLMHNSKWLSKMNFSDILKLSSCVTVQQMLHREMFDKRMKEDAPIGVHEFMYPLMQGYDSVAMDVDMEVGGSDQLFNMLVGRDLQKIYNNKEKYVVGVKLLLGTDGRKMSKSYDNAIYLSDEPNDMFGKIMSINDNLIADYVELCTNLNLDEVKKMPNPRDQKAVLAKEIVLMYHGAGAADMAEEEFNKTFRDKNPEFEKVAYNNKQVSILDLLVELKLATSKNEAKRLVTQKAVKINGQVEADWQKQINATSGIKIQVGPRKFIELL